MICSFSRYFPDKRPTNFKAKILDGSKKTTIRAYRKGQRQWQLSDIMDLFIGNYYQPDYHKFAKSTLAHITPILIEKDWTITEISPLHQQLRQLPTLQVADNDGLNLDDFMLWFGPKVPFNGLILKWAQPVINIEGVK